MTIKKDMITFIMCVWIDRPENSCWAEIPVFPLSCITVCSVRSARVPDKEVVEFVDALENLMFHDADGPLCKPRDFAVRDKVA